MYRHRGTLRTRQRLKDGWVPAREGSLGLLTTDVTRKHSCTVLPESLCRGDHRKVAPVANASSYTPPDGCWLGSPGSSNVTLMTSEGLASTARASKTTEPPTCTVILKPSGGVAFEYCGGWSMGIVDRIKFTSEPWRTDGGAVGADASLTLLVSSAHLLRKFGSSNGRYASSPGDKGATVSRYADALITEATRATDQTLTSSSCPLKKP
mmetsp:Transcript_22196/g.55993  ORF Transcript_22196/g.55993 Transcript_22196/m.55993 type:complete len:209 (+) Transcript_22196:489-1115(+)